MCSSIVHMLFAAAILLGVQGLPQNSSSLVERQTNGKLVYAHFMIGVVSDRTSASAYDVDMQRAKSMGIDAFALNIGTDSYTDQQLGFAYQSPANNGLKVFISFDLNWWNNSQESVVGSKIAQYASHPAQLIVNGKVVVSSFAGDGLNVATMRAAAGPEGGVTVTVNAGDQLYGSALGSKGYIAPVSPWFSTHFGPEIPYSKNWVFPSDLLCYGESHYVGPSSPHSDDGSSKWVNDMPHDDWLDMVKPFVQSYKAGSTNALNCDATDTTMQPANDVSGNYFEGRPNGYQTTADNVFVMTLLRTASTIVVNSGSTAYMFDAPAGASAFSVPFQSEVMQNTCPCGIYNFNAYVGTVPPGARDVPQSDGLSNFAEGLKVACVATPSLPATPPAITLTIAATAAPTAPII
ncbi:glycosyl hydrolase family 71-domain-containing protein [Mycena galopus ATCC 62051]|nr:glycosyl hydrolase family 71-domain-containing protein [Mycena galopus ATCC 62051]